MVSISETLSLYGSLLVIERINYVSEKRQSPESRQMIIDAVKLKINSHLHENVLSMSGNVSLIRSINALVSEKFLFEQVTHRNRLNYTLTYKGDAVIRFIKMVHNIGVGEVAYLMLNNWGAIGVISTLFNESDIRELTSSEIYNLIENVGEWRLRATLDFLSQTEGLIERTSSPPNTTIHSLTEYGKIVGKLLNELIITAFS